MKKIGDVTSTADKNGEWTNGNVAAGIAPTILEAGWLNSVQREILGVLVEAGIAQDKNNDNQLKDAIKKIISGGNYATKTEVNSKLAKDQNGADIPDKPKFIENLGLDTALNNQPKSATLTALARLSGVGNTLPYFNGVDYADLTEFTSIGRSIVGQASVAGVVDYLGLKDALNALIKTNNLSDLQNVVTSRSNLGVPKGVDKQMCAAWASFGYRDDSVVIDDGFNISSITRFSRGGYKVVFLTPLNSAKYSVSGSASHGSSGTVVFSPCSANGEDARTTTSFELSINDASDNSLKDSNFINFQVFGGV